MDSSRLRLKLAGALFTLLLLLVLADARVIASAAGSSSESGAAPQLPSAKEVIERFVKEIGGRTAFKKIDSQHLTGKVELAGQGITGKVEVFAKRPDKLLMKMTLPGVGDVTQGFDGKTGWSVDPVTGPMLLEGKILAQFREQARFDALLHEATEFRTMQTVAKTPFEGKECYKLKLVMHSGDETIEYYDVKTGLLAGSSETQQTPLGAMPVTALVSDYRKFGEVLFATRLSQKVGPMTQVMTFDTMELNKVDEAVFTLPEPIKALLK